MLLRSAILCPLVSWISEEDECLLNETLVCLALWVHTALLLALSNELVIGMIVLLIKAKKLDRNKISKCYCLGLENYTVSEAWSLKYNSCGWGLEAWSIYLTPESRMYRNSQLVDFPIWLMHVTRYQHNLVNNDDHREWNSPRYYPSSIKQATGFRWAPKT